MFVSDRGRRPSRSPACPNATPPINVPAWPTVGCAGVCVRYAPNRYNPRCL